MLYMYRIYLTTLVVIIITNKNWICQCSRSNSKTHYLKKSRDLPLRIRFYSDESLKIECNIEGIPIPTYQWYVASMKESEFGSEFEHLNYKKLENEKSYSLELDGRKSSVKYFKNVYYCAAQNKIGILHSNKIIIEKMTRPASIEIKYTPHNVYKGEKFVIKCHPVPDWLGTFLKFKRWEVVLISKNTLSLTNTEGRYSVISITKNPQLHIRNVTEKDFEATKVRCVFQSTIGSRKELTDGSFQKVDKFPYDAAGFPTEIKCQGESLNVYAGTDVELPWCSNPKTLQVKWYKVNKDTESITEVNLSNNSKFQMVSKRYGNLKISNISKFDEGKYIASSSKGKKMKSQFIIKVYETPRVNLQPKVFKTNVNVNASFKCFSSDPKSKFYWLHNGRPVKSGYDYNNIVIIQSRRASILQIKKTRISVSGIFQCIVTIPNQIKLFDEIRQEDAMLILRDFLPSIVKQSPRVEKDSDIAQVQISSEMKRLNLECVFAASPKPKINWYLNGKRVPIKSFISELAMDDPKSIYNKIAKLSVDLDEITDVRKYAGEYKAVASNSFGSSSCTFLAFIDGMLELRLPENQRAIMEQDFLMSCYFVGSTIPEFSWSRKIKQNWESLPTSQKTVMHNKNYNLLIKNVIKEEDEGKYKCTARYKGKSISSITTVKVANPPRIQKLGSKNIQDISKRHINKCSVSNSADTPWYAWWTFNSYRSNVTYILEPQWADEKFKRFSIRYDQSSFNENTDSNDIDENIPTFVFKYPNKGPDLEIRKRSSGDYEIGIFKCHVKNAVGYDTYIITDSYQGIEFEKIPQSSTDAIIGQDIVLECSAKKSDLNPIVKWKIRNAEGTTDIKELKIFKNRIFFYHNGTLIIKNVTESDPKELICYIISPVDKNQNDSRVAHIDIRVPAKIMKMNPKIEHRAATSFNLSCNIYGDMDELEVKWFYRKNSIDKWRGLAQNCIYKYGIECMNEYIGGSVFITRITYNATVSSVKLLIQDASETSAGNYKCEAKNKFNSHPVAAMTKLTIISPPSKVEIEDIGEAITSKTVSFKWTSPMKNGNKPIIGYVIEWYEVSGNKKKTKVFTVNNTVHSFTIKNLKPSRLYRIKVSAENEVGKSEASLIDLRTHEAKPDKSVRNIKASTSKPHEIFIIWNAPNPDYQNGKIIQYEICYQIMPSVDNDKVVLSLLKWPDNFNHDIDKVTCLHSTQETVTISHLPQFTEFAIRIRAFNKIGPSPPAFTKVRTLEDLPQAPPTSLICEKGDQFIELKWNPPPRQTLNGVLIGYVLQLYEPNKYGDESNIKRIHVQGRSHYKIDHLKPNTEYSIKVMAENRKGLGPPSANLVCVTSESKPGPPESVKATRINNTCISVSWLHTKRPNGKIKKYCVVGLSYGRDDYSMKCQAPNFNIRYNHLVLCNDLYEFSRVKVFAKNTYSGIPLEASDISQYNSIISFGGNINVTDNESVILPCETHPSYKEEITWNKDNVAISNIYHSNYKILKNYSLLIKSVEAFDSSKYTCIGRFDSISFHLNIKPSPNGLPAPPVIYDGRVTENSIFIIWFSSGTTDVTAPINGFILNWRNNFETQTINLDQNIRTYYLNNLTCATDYVFRIRAQNRLGVGDFSDEKIMRTMGKRPEVADVNKLLPVNNIKSQSAYFNLKAFGPGENCSANKFVIELSLPSHGSFNFQHMKINISVFDLKDNCCYKVKDLNPATEYMYRVTAINPAGITQAYNAFTTSSSDTTSTNVRRKLENQPNGYIQSWVLIVILLIIFIVLIIFVVVIILFAVRNKEKKSQAPKEMVNTFDTNKKSKYDCDNMSIDSTGEPSPYAVYQPDDDKNNQWAPPMTQSNIGSTPSYNYPENIYNKVQYGYKPHIRRANSAECLSSNASVSGLGDLESPANINPDDNRNNRFSDEFSQIQPTQFSTLRPSRNGENYNAAMYRKKLEYSSRQQEADYSRILAAQHQQQQQQQRPNYQTQMSMPERNLTNIKHYGQCNERNRSDSGNFSNSSALLLNRNNPQPTYNGYHRTNMGPTIHPNMYGSRKNSGPRIIDPTMIPINISREQRPVNYSQIPSTSTYYTRHREEQRPVEESRPPVTACEAADESIYTDRVVVV